MTEISKLEIALQMPTVLSHYFTEEPRYVAEPLPSGKPGLLARLAGVVRWFVELPQRRAVLDELSALSDHELADIGLARGDLPRVFDPAFAEQRNADRRAIRAANRRAATA
jgi:uncharacterized protein YjiS (DUF1127 family)